MKEKAEAITAFRRVLDVEPNNLDANWHLYRLFTEDNNLNASKFRFERLFKGLADKTAEPELLRKIENTLICYFKSYLTEMAVIISRTENPDATQKDFFINYDRIAGTVIADLIPTDSLFCPDCGKFYTSYINHVSCPVHGYSEILTENITDIKEVRKRYNQEICLRNRYGLILAIAQYRLATGEKHPENFNHLVKEGFLLDIPQCPNGGSFKVDEKGLIRCEIHGELENLRQ
jgi:hypothetical protein